MNRHPLRLPHTVPAMPRRQSIAGRSPQMVAASALLGAAALASPALAIPDLLVNGGFEVGPVTGHPNGMGIVPRPWESFVSAGQSRQDSYDTWSTVPQTGLNPATNTTLFPLPIAAAEGVRWAGGKRSGLLFQTLSAPLVPGATYNISALIHGTHSGLGFGGLDFVLFDGSHGGVSNTTLVATTPPVFYTQGWVTWNASFIAPAGAVRLQEFGIRGSMGSTDQYMCVDDVHVNQVPLPGTAALLALAGVTTMRRRRR